MKIEKKIVAYEVVDLAAVQSGIELGTERGVSRLALEEHLNSIGLMKLANVCDKCETKALLSIDGCLTCFNCGG